MVPVPAVVAGDLPHRSRTVRLSSVDHSPAPGSPVGRFMATASPEALFVLSATAQYIGAVIAIDLFDRVDPATVAWLRVFGAAVALLLVSGRHLFRPWTRADFVAMTVFGVATALMNTFFYLAIDRLPLGKGVAIEFIGPIAVAAVRTRSRRNAFALILAAIGVAVLSGVELDGEPLGLLFIFLASAMWATYIVVGSKVAQQNRGVSGLGFGLLIGAVVVTPIGAPSSGPVWSSPHLIFLCMFVGVMSNAIGYGIDQAVLRRIPIRRFSVLLALLPVTATVVAFVALDQRPSLIDLAGMSLVLAGVIVQEREKLDT
ncbi:MAG: EamA family transporter [Actinobacteria bacterium]|nr:EamA family transporter [Actinomycetota bacterium]